VLYAAEDSCVPSDVGVFTNAVFVERAINVEPLTGTESFVVVMTFTDVVVAVCGVVVVVVVVVTV